MVPVKPALVLHSAIRFKCLGISNDRYLLLNDIATNAVLFMGVLAENREDGTMSLSTLCNLVWDKFQPQTNEEAFALAFHCGILYQQSSSIMWGMQAAGFVRDLLEEKGWKTDRFEHGILFDEFHDACMAKLAEDPSYEETSKTDEVVARAAAEDLSMFSQPYVAPKREEEEGDVEGVQVIADDVPADAPIIGVPGFQQGVA